jgi:formate hydrogenlyase transcriptional activator
MQAQLEPELAERYEALFRAFRSLGSTQDPTQLIRVLPAELRPFVDFDYIKLFLRDVVTRGTSWYVSKAGDGSCLSLTSEAPPEETLSSFASVRTIPLMAAHRRLGDLTVASRYPGAYSDGDGRLLGMVADLVAGAIECAVNFQRLHLAQAESVRSVERLRLILDVNNSIVSNLDLHELLRSISANLRRVLQCEIASVWLPDPDGHSLRCYALDFPESRGFVKEDLLREIDDSTLGMVFKTGKPLVAPKRELAADSLAREEGIESGFALPLIGRNRTLGVLALGRRDGNSFGPQDVEFLELAAGQVAIAIENAFAYGEIGDLKNKLAQEKLYLEEEIRSEMNFEEIVGHSPALRRVLKEIETVAPTDSTVLIYGETGTGKELIARAIHDLSPRRANTFVKLSCAAIPAGLLESELFGHEKGAFTGAISQRIGRFELGNHGTVFLDEIGEVPLELQPKLLRVLQEREFERLGSSRTQRTDARLVAATNRDLAAMVEDQQFRADLFYRLNVFPVHVPPLRERPEDVPLLVRHFFQEFARRMNKTIETVPKETMDALTRYAWPGNVRELQNLMERATILSPGPVLRVPLGDLKAQTGPAADGVARGTLEETDRAHILATLKETKWVLSGPNGAAARLGLNRSTLQFRMRKLGIVRPGR